MKGRRQASPWRKRALVILSLAASVAFAGYLSTLSHDDEPDTCVRYVIVTTKKKMFVLAEWEVMRKLAYKITDDMNAGKGAGFPLFSNDGLYIPGTCEYINTIKSEFQSIYTFQDTTSEKYEELYRKSKGE